MRAQRLAVTALAILAAVAFPAAAAGAAGPVGTSAQPGGWLVGAAKVDITPPAFNAADDATDYGAACATGSFTGPRQFRFEEPYADANGNGLYDFGEPYCDANANGRWDGIFVSGGVGELATTVHDQLFARAFAIGHGNDVAVVASVTAQGLFKNYVDDIRAKATAARPQIDGIVVSANHNESSPDTVGIYGAPSLDGEVGGRSGIDDYYMDFLDARVATAIDKAYDAMRPGRLSVTQVPLPSGLPIRLSDNFPTTDDQGRPAAVDPNVRVLQAADASGQSVFTVMNLAAHNQEIGHGDNTGQLSEDWPGYYERALDQQLGGTSIFLVGDNGSIEDPALDHDGTYEHAQASGAAFAQLVSSALPALTPLAPGDVRLTTSTFDVPLQNNLFVAAAAAGLFGKRTVDPTGASAQGPVALQTEVGVLDVGPDLQMLLWPGETFPALAVGSPWGIEDAPCADRANPPVAAWHAGATWRFEVGLADDMLGYLLPPWAFATEPGFTQSTCTTDPNADKDSKGHQHKLEDESVGWDAAGDIATQLSALLDRDPVVRDTTASIQTGRFVLADGTLSHSPAGAVALWLTDPQSTSLTPGTGTLVALPGIRGFGTGTSRVVPDAYGEFIDYDGTVQPGGPDITTRGMAVVDGDGGVVHRWYADVYPALTGSSLGAADGGPGATLPEVPAAVLLPIVGAIVFAGWWAIRRRRTRD